MNRTLIAGNILIATLAFAIEPALAQGRGQKTNSDWPCRQLLVHEISVPAVWAGPAIDNVDWQSDPKVADLAAKLAQRRVPLEAAQGEITEFSKTLGSDKSTKLTALFAGLYQKLNTERTQLIDGLDRFGRSQKELGNKLREETAALHKAQDESSAPLPDIRDKSSPEAAADPAAAVLEKLQWDMRIFESRHKAVSFACESPIIIEQRLFALAKTIQENL